MASRRVAEASRTANIAATATTTIAVAEAGNTEERLATEGTAETNRSPHSLRSHIELAGPFKASNTSGVSKRGTSFEVAVEPIIV